MREVNATLSPQDPSAEHNMRLSSMSHSDSRIGRFLPLEVYKIQRLVSPSPGWLVRSGALLLRFSVSSCALQKNNLPRCCLLQLIGRLACGERQAWFDALRLAAHGHIISVFIGVYPSRYPRAPFVAAVRHRRLIRLVV